MISLFRAKLRCIHGHRYLLFIQDSTVALQSYQSLGNKPGLETGLRGQNKVSALAKDLAIKFSGDSAPPPAKKEAVENKVTEVEKVCTSTMWLTECNSRTRLERHLLLHTEMPRYRQSAHKQGLCVLDLILIEKQGFAQLNFSCSRMTLVLE